MWWDGWGARYNLENEVPENMERCCNCETAVRDAGNQDDGDET